MKNSLVLWVAAAILTFLLVFIQNRTSQNYPISGTIGIEGQKVSYFFKKIHKDKNDFILMIRTDIKELKGVVKWKPLDEKLDWNIDTMKYSTGSLSVTIPRQNILSEVEYRLFLNYNNKEYLIPKNNSGKILFLGAVPSAITIHYYLTLFLGLFLAMRTGLEYFNAKPRLRLYSIFASISFFSFAMIFAPVKKAYEMGAIGKSVPAIGELFTVWSVMLIIIWIANLILVSYSRIPKKWALAFPMLTILIFYSQNFL